MKSLREIKQAAKKGDYVTVSEIVGKSRSLVQAVVNGERTDHHRIRKTFSDLLEHRERVADREERRRERARKEDEYA